MRLPALLALALAACGDDHQTTINNYPATGGAAAGGEGGTGGASTSSSGGAGGAGGAEVGGGGEGGAGGGPCVPLTCADVHGACGPGVADGCGGAIDCAGGDAVCGYTPEDPWLWCDPKGGGVCTCNDASSVADAVAICSSSPAAQAHCGGAACAPAFCGKPDAAKPAPLDCLHVDDVPNASPDVWCCQP